MRTAAVTACIQIPGKLLHRDVHFVHAAFQFFQTFLPLRSAHNLTNAREKNIHGRYGFSVIILTHVKSLELKAKHPLFKDFGGLHHIYVNNTGLETLKKGGLYADGSVFVFDLIDVKSDDAATAEANRKVLGVMYKNANTFSATGGWGFEGFKGDSRDRLVAGKHEACFGCHASEKSSDFVFSKYRN